jgi:photosystem II stability/assembly factor-like uncharacterized protein
MQAVAMVAVIAITLGTVGALLLSRNARHLTQGAIASGTRVSSPARVSPPPTPYTPLVDPTPVADQISAPSATVVWTTFDGRLFRSTDRGETWSEQRSLPPVQHGGAPEISFISAQEGWYLSGGASAYASCNGVGTEIWHTTDGAVTWTQVDVHMWTVSHTSDSAMATSIPECRDGLSFIDPLHGFVSAGGAFGGRHPTIYRTVDGGKNWAGSDLPDPPDFKTRPTSTLQARAVKQFGSSLYVVAYVGGNADRDYVFRSTDGGGTWSWMTKIPALNTVMVTESRWLILKSYGLSMESTNSGQQWHSYESDYSFDIPNGGSWVVFGDSQVGYIEGRGRMHRTLDGGLHWTAIARPGACHAEPATPGSSWLTHSSAKWRYSVNYPADWCNLPNFGVTDESNKYFSNENAGSPLELTSFGMFAVVGVAPGACPTMDAFKEVYERATLKVAGQDVTRTYGFYAPGQSESAVMIHAAIARGGNCYKFDFITHTRATGDKYLTTADKMIASLKFS